MKKILVLLAAILLAAVNLYAAPGDVNIEGKLGVGTTTPAAKVHVSGGDVVVEGRVGIGETSPAADLHVNGTVKMFGDRVARVANTVYQAESDGFLFGYLFVNTLSTGNLAFYVGPSDPPTSIVMRSGKESGPASIAVYGTFFMPVKKGDYYKAFYDGDLAYYNMYWMPLGN